ncbi:uncharacterized protein F4817DRAFT_363351 [Daldinia loculata]|uniref:uncharacterized protein n=1 Tax=Daldinia loculata TaxID=103429 RepID=UPI0020C46468|nr:uncharacterized protein F4817DRAFT_363351 [Daldinia loculata]KAI1642010.1 hypothetical protein F4817DRAFT_363351 [Daldinia loculata]
METSSPLPTASGPIANSPSDLSYSSGASRTSTRNTSPDSTDATTSSELASQLLDLGLNTNIEHTPNSLLDSQLKMDRNPFQSVNERRNKLVTDRSNTTQIQQPQQPQQHQQQHFQPQTLRPSMQSLSMGVRNLASSNWRSQTADEAALSARTGEFPPFDLTVGHHTQQGSGGRHSSYASPRSDQFQQQQQQQLLSSMMPYSVSSNLNDFQLDSSYAYCYDRGNGQYTRLIPADMLPALKDIPPLQQNCSGMLVLPLPRGLPSNGRSSNTNPVILRSPTNSPSSTSDNIQSRIDTIVASTPPTPTSLSMATGVAGLGPGSAAGATGLSLSQHAQHPHQHTSHNSGHNHPQQPQRRPKIYCDKWVHEGVCAFTQQGCKYKHEMPFDKVTQHQLGLFHGFPAWWKKHQADLSRQRDGPEDSVRLSSGSERFAGRAGGCNNSGGHSATASADVAGMAPGLPSWRRSADGIPTEQKALGTGRGMARDMRGGGGGGGGGGIKNPFVSYSSPFGPIAPPARTSSTTPAAFTADHLDTGTASKTTGGAGGNHGSAPNANPYSSLEALEESANGKGGEEAKASVGGSSGARLI